MAAGKVDMAVGGDQGGSIRIPAAYCGVYGLLRVQFLMPARPDLIERDGEEGGDGGGLEVGEDG